MKDIKKVFYDILRNNSTVQTQLGGDAQDNRVLYWYPQIEVELSDNKPAYITLHESGSGNPHIEKEKRHFNIAIWSKDAELIEQIFETVDPLFHNQILSLDNHYNILTVRKIDEDFFPEDNDIHGKNILYLVETIKK